MHQQRLKDTKEIRARNEQRSRGVSNNASSKYEEALFCAMLQNDIARQMNPHLYRDDDDDSYDNDFDDTPAGNWYYKYHPDERSMHQQRLKDTEAIRRKTEHRSSAFSARLEREEAESKAMENEICAMFERELHDVERMRERQNKEQHKMRREKDVSEIDIMKELQSKSTEDIGSKFASLGLNEKQPSINKLEEDIKKKPKRKGKGNKSRPKKHDDHELVTPDGFPKEEEKAEEEW